MIPEKLRIVQAKCGYYPFPSVGRGNDSMRTSFARLLLKGLVVTVSFACILVRPDQSIAQLAGIHFEWDRARVEREFSNYGIPQVRRGTIEAMVKDIVESDFRKHSLGRGNLACMLYARPIAIRSKFDDGMVLVCFDRAGALAVIAFVHRGHAFSMVVRHYSDLPSHRKNAENFSSARFDYAHEGLNVPMSLFWKPIPHVDSYSIAVYRVCVMRRLCT